MLRLRVLLASELVAATALLLVACAPALDFDSLTSGHRPSADASEDTSEPRDAAGEASSTDAVEEYAADPCANVDAGNNGWYCGRSTQAGFSGGNPLDLYHCVNGMATAVQCPNGCIIAPPTFEDVCDYCNGKADGTYCGSQFGYMQPSDRLLIVCSAGHIPDGGVTPCPNSCVLTGGAHCG